MVNNLPKFLRCRKAHSLELWSSNMNYWINSNYDPISVWKLWYRNLIPNVNGTILRLESKLCQNLTFINFPRSKSSKCFMVGPARVILEMNSGHKHKKIVFLFKAFTTILKNFMHCQRFPYMHLEGAFLCSLFININCL